MEIKHLRLIKTNSQLGTLLLDSLTAIAILAIVFAVSFPNYQRARQQAAVGVDAQQLDAINTAVVLYGNDHKGSFAGLEGLPDGSVSATNPGASYLSVAPVSPIDGASPYNLVVPPAAGNTAPYAIVDSAQETDTTLLGNYHEIDGTTSCSGSGDDYLAEDPVHGIYCVATNQG
jgi:type II secretory pathway pseudopilin PulG